jgi:hypothetical protein
VATEIDEVSDAEATKNRFGHTSKTVTERRYINRTLVVPGYRAATERLAPGSGPGHGAEPVTGDSALSHAWLRQGCPQCKMGHSVHKAAQSEPKGGHQSDWWRPHHRRSEPVFSSSATHSTWCVIGKI